MDTPDQAPCPKCGHLNERTWMLCDNCGEALPWAVPKQFRKSINELSDEQLDLYFGGPTPRQPPWWTTPIGRKSLIAILVIISLLWMVLGHR